jgi:hypothetical protein
VGFALLLNMQLFILLTDMVDGFRQRFESSIMKPLIEAVMKANIILEEILQDRLAQNNPRLNSFGLDCQHAGGLGDKCVENFRRR